MEYKLNEKFSLKPVKTAVGYQIEWSAVYGDDEVLKRWRRFFGAHPLTQRKDRVKFCTTLRDANTICRAFIERERARKVVPAP